MPQKLLGLNTWQRNAQIKVIIQKGHIVVFLIDKRVRCSGPLFIIIFNTVPGSCDKII